MSRREKHCAKILYDNCRGLIWSQIKSLLEYKEFDVIKVDGSEISITHIRMMEFRQQGRLHTFSADRFNVHVGKGSKSKIGKGDCEKIQRAMNGLELTHC